TASRAVMRRFVAERGLRAILDQGYYAFIHVGEWLQRRGWKDSEPLGEYMAEEHGLAGVPGAYFSSFGGGGNPFSYAAPPARGRSSRPPSTERPDSRSSGTCSTPLSSRCSASAPAVRRAPSPTSSA